MLVQVKMRFMQQPLHIPVRNVDDSVGQKKFVNKRHSMLLPNTIRCIIAGPSSSGKTNLLISMLESEISKCVHLFKDIGAG